MNIDTCRWVLARAAFSRLDPFKELLMAFSSERWLCKDVCRFEVVQYLPGHVVAHEQVRLLRGHMSCKPSYRRVSASASTCGRRFVVQDADGAICYSYILTNIHMSLSQRAVTAASARPCLTSCFIQAARLTSALAVA